MAVKMGAMPENEEARKYLMEVSALHEDLRTAVRMLEEARSPFDSASEDDKEWLENKKQFVAAMSFEHFGGPEPDLGPGIPY